MLITFRVSVLMLVSLVGLTCNPALGADGNLDRTIEVDSNNVKFGDLIYCRVRVRRNSRLPLQYPVNREFAGAKVEFNTRNSSVPKQPGILLHESAQSNSREFLAIKEVREELLILPIWQAITPAPELPRDRLAFETDFDFLLSEIHRNRWNRSPLALWPSLLPITAQVDLKAFHLPEDSPPMLQLLHVEGTAVPPKLLSQVYRQRGAERNDEPTIGNRERMRITAADLGVLLSPELDYYETAWEMKYKLPVECCLSRFLEILVMFNGHLKVNPSLTEIPIDVMSAFEFSGEIEKAYLMQVLSKFTEQKAIPLADPFGK